MCRLSVSRHVAAPLGVGPASATAGSCGVSGALYGQAVQSPLMEMARSSPGTTWLKTIDLWARAVVGSGLVLDRGRITRSASARPLCGERES